MGYKDLWFFKTRNSVFGRVEARESAGNRDYSTETFTGTVGPLPLNEDGSYAVFNGDLYFIKTKNCQSGKIELVSFSRGSRFQQTIASINTGFSASEAANGTFIFNGGTLYLVKTRRTASDKVEVWFTSGDHQKVKGPYPTGFTVGDDLNGQWDIIDWNDKMNIFFIKCQNTGSGRIEVHQSTHRKFPGVFFEGKDSWATALGAENNGTFKIGNQTGDLHYIKTRNCASGCIEVFVVPRSVGFSIYPSIVSYKTHIAAFEGGNGLFTIEHGNQDQ